MKNFLFCLSLYYMFSLWIKPTFIFIENNTESSIVVKQIYPNFFSQHNQIRTIYSGYSERIGVSFGAVFNSGTTIKVELAGRQVIKDLTASQFGFFCNAYTINVTEAWGGLSMQHVTSQNPLPQK